MLKSKQIIMFSWNFCTNDFDPLAGRKHECSNSMFKPKLILTLVCFWPGGGGLAPRPKITN